MPETQDKPIWAEKIKAVRQRLGFNQAQFAERMGTTQSNISKWENGEYKPSPEQFMRLSRMAVGEVESLLFMELGGVPAAWWSEGHLGPHIPTAFTGEAIQRAEERTATELIASGYIEEKTGQIRHVPLLKDSAAAGTPRAVDDKEVERLIGVPKDWLPRGGHLYAVKVVGDSMSPLLETGYVVILDVSQTDPEPLIDRMVAAKIDGELTIKWLRHDPKTGMYLLVPQHTSQRHPIRLFNKKTRDVSIVGEVVSWTAWPPRKRK